jgi:hypothetical protein
MDPPYPATEPQSATPAEWCVAKQTFDDLLAAQQVVTPRAQ